MHLRNLLKLGLLLLLAAGTVPSAAAAGSGSEKQVVALEVQGNHYIESAAILARVGMKVGDRVDRKQISRDVRELFATGYFADVYVEGVPAEGGIKLVYRVKENPVIAGFAIEGNDGIPDKDLKPKLKLEPGRVFSESLLRQDRAAIRKAYLKKGYYQVDVSADTTPRSDGRIDVTLNISEGKITRIKRIQFIGNKAFSDDKLRDQLRSKRSTLTSWFSDNDVFNRERFGDDAKMLQLYYLNHGYLDMKVESTQLSLTPDKRNFYLTFAIYEGVPYTVSKVELQGDLVPSREVLEEAISLKPGDLYSLTELQKSIQAVTEKVGDEGYAFATVTPLFKRDTVSRQVAIAFDIEKGREVYVERIDISGNEKSEDSVIRRELRQFEGARYSASKVELSKTRLNRSQLYDDVRLSMPKGSADDKVRLKVEVDEKKSGSLSVGAGYSQLEKVFVTSSLEEKNLFGKGYEAKVKADVGGKTQNYDLSLRDPYLFDSEVSGVIRTYKTDSRLSTITTYNQNTLGATAGLDVPITEHLVYGISYTFDRSELTNVPANASLLALAQQGVQTTGELTQALVWDTRDRTLGATSGHAERLNVGVAGLGGFNRFLEAGLSTSSYFSLGNNFVLNPKLSGKYITGLGARAVPIYRRYSMGGANSIRGFDSYGISLRDPVTRDPLGGDREVSANINLFFPIPYLETPGIRGVAFVDAGTVWGSVNAVVGNTTLNVSEPFSGSRIRSSAGFGIEWLSPMGPIALIWGFPIRKQPGDIPRTFEFALGTTF